MSDVTDDKFNLSKETQCYWGDNNLFMELPLGLLSFSFHSPKELKDFCNFLDQIRLNHDYIDSESIISELLIALEAEDEGRRNLCMRDNKLYLVINLGVEKILEWSAWLRLNVKNIEIVPDEPKLEYAEIVLNDAMLVVARCAQDVVQEASSDSLDVKQFYIVPKEEMDELKESIKVWNDATQKFWRL